MIGAFGSELMSGFVQLFINPVFYVVVIVAFILGRQRVQEERRHFHVRVDDMVTDLFHTFIPGLMAGVLLSLVIFSIGFILPEGTIVLLMSVTLLLMFFFRPRLLSPAFTFSLALFIALFVPSIQTNVTVLDKWLNEIGTTPIESYFLLLVLLLLGEALLILLQATRRSSPRRLKSKRGKAIGGFETTRLWLVPTFMLIPSSTGLDRMDWWPFFIDTDTFVFMLVPFVIGFRQFQLFALPEEAVRREGRWLCMFALLSVPVAFATLMYEWSVVAYAGIAVTLAIRFILYWFIRRDNRILPSYFTEQDNGVMILGIIPKTPAAEMNLKVGEVIQKVNDQPVKSAREFYRALRENATFCKLEVIDQHGELRYEQRALFDDEHHELGLLFVDASR